MAVLHCPKECCCSCVQVPDCLQIPGRFATKRQEPPPLKTLGDWEPEVRKDPITRCSKDCCAGFHEVIRFPKEISLPPNIKIAPGIYVSTNIKPRQKVKDIGLSRSGQYQPQGDKKAMMWQQGHYMGQDSGIQSGAGTQAPSLNGHEMDDDMDTGAGCDQVMFNMDQGFPQSFTQEQVDEMNQQLNQTRSGG